MLVNISPFLKVVTQMKRKSTSCDRHFTLLCLYFTKRKISVCSKRISIASFNQVDLIVVL